MKINKKVVSVVLILSIINASASGCASITRSGTTATSPDGNSTSSGYVKEESSEFRPLLATIAMLLLVGGLAAISTYQQNHEK